MGGLSLNRDFEAMFPLSREESPTEDSWGSMLPGRGPVGRRGRGTLASFFRGRGSRAGRGSLAGPGALILGAGRCPRSREIPALPQATGLLVHWEGRTEVPRTFSEMREKAGPGLGGRKRKCREKGHPLTPG